ncbi:hypothetical protein Pla163_25530 [Planctomycetes bacterium Pla163]|uniref:DUF1573 domain-containing protein n=1 Tax=Rohdeia mirabilis TaxID=2528008 RepID=A0A518D1S3_9BACT|nr:hypothetical protein Pla163_25530 [Planctomycetes bacterium Pla163]
MQNSKTRLRPLASLAATALLFGGLHSCSDVLEGSAPETGPSASGAVSQTVAAAGADQRTPAPKSAEVDETSAPSKSAASEKGGAGARDGKRPAKLEGIDLSEITLPGGAKKASAQPVVVPTVDATLVIDGEDTARFGTVVEGDEEEHIFELHVDGAEPITIFEDKSTCGCTMGRMELIAADGSVSEYKVGEKIPVDTTLRVHGKLKTEGKKGPNHHTITLRHNGSNRASMLHFEAEVTPIFDVKPNAYLNFREMFVNETRTAELTVTSPVAKMFKLSLDEGFALPKFLSVELVPVEPDADGRAGTWKVIGTMGPDTPENLGGQQGLTVILNSDQPHPGLDPLPDGSPRMRTLTLFAAARVKALVHARPSYISFGAVSVGNSAQRVFRIEFGDDSFTPDIERMRAAKVMARSPEQQEFYDDFFDVSVAAVEGERAFEVTMAYENWPADRVGPFNGDLVVDVGHPTKPHLRVPFSGVCRPTTVQH